MRIRIVSAIHGRPEIVRIFALGIERLKQDFEISINTVVSCTEDYDHAKSLGLNPFVTPNKPLGAKHNVMVKNALKDQWDYLVIMNSDGLMSSQGLKELIASKAPHAGFSGMYAVDVHSTEAVSFRYNHPGRLIGTGRMLSREVVESSSGGLWEPDIDRGLDHSLESALSYKGISPVDLHRNSTHVIDLKSRANLWAYDRLHQFNAEIQPAQPWDWFLSDKEKEAIYELKGKTINPIPEAGVSKAPEVKQPQYKRGQRPPVLARSVRIEMAKNQPEVTYKHEITESQRKQVKMQVEQNVASVSDVVIILFTYNRQKLLLEVLKHIKKYSYPIYVLDDGSTYNYSEHKKYCTNYIRFKHGGKWEWWRMWNVALEICRKNPARKYVFTVDDFQNIDISGLVKDHGLPENSAINIIRDSREDSWGERIWQPYGEHFIESNFVDCGFVCDYAVMRQIPVLKAPTQKQEHRSSGVGAQITKAFRQCEIRMFTPVTSFARHGDHPSQMNPAERMKNPLISR